MAGREKGGSRQGMRRWERMLGIFFAPGETARELVARPDLVAPVFFFLLTAVASAPIAMEATTLALQTAGRPVPVGAGALVGRMIGTFIALLLVWPVRAFFLYGLGLLFSPSVTYKQSLSAAGFLSGIESLASIVGEAVFATTGIVLSPGLAAGLTLGERLFSAHGAAFQELNIFTLWYLAVSTVVLAKLYRVSRVKAAIVTLVLWGIVFGAKLMLISWQLKAVPS